MCRPCGKGSLKLPHPLCSSPLIPVPVNISGDPGGLFAPQQDCENSRWMSHQSHCRLWAWHHLVLGTAMGLVRAEERAPGDHHGCQQGESPTACIRERKGTPRTDRVPIAILSGINSKSPNRTEKETSPPPFGHIQPCTYRVDYESMGDVTEGQKNAQTP